MGQKRQYRTQVVDGRQYLNGQQVQTIIDPKQKKCTITDPGNREGLAQRSFQAGAIAARNDPALETEEVSEVIDDSVGVYRPSPRPRFRRRRRDG